MFASIWFGMMFTIAGVSVGLWQILSAPDRPNYPTSGPVKRVLMFWFSGSLLFRAVDVFTSIGAGTQTPLQASAIMSSTLLAALMVTFLVDHVRHWLPARTHERIRQLLAIARCRPTPELQAARASSDMAAGSHSMVHASAVTPALVELTLAGFTVAGPNDGPEALR